MKTTKKIAGILLIVLLIVLSVFMISCEKETITPIEPPITDTIPVVDTIPVEQEHCWICDIMYEGWFYEAASDNPGKIPLWLTWNYNNQYGVVYDINQASHWRKVFTGTREEMDSVYENRPNFVNCGVPNYNWKLINVSGQTSDFKLNGCYKIY